MTNLHNHAPSPTRIQVAANTGTAPRVIVNQNLAGISDHAKASLPKLVNLEKSAYRKRKAIGAQVPIPHALSDIQIPDNLRRTRTVLHEDFVLADTGPEDERRIIIFGSNTDVARLASCEVWLADGTFKAIAWPMRPCSHCFKVTSPMMSPLFFVLVPTTSTLMSKQGLCFCPNGGFGGGGISRRHQRSSRDEEQQDGVGETKSSTPLSAQELSSAWEVFLRRKDGRAAQQAEKKQHDEKTQSPSHKEESAETAEAGPTVESNMLPKAHREERKRKKEKKEKRAKRDKKRQHKHHHRRHSSDAKNDEGEKGQENERPKRKRKRHSPSSAEEAAQSSGSEGGGKRRRERRKNGGGTAESADEEGEGRKAGKSSHRRSSGGMEEKNGDRKKRDKQRR